MSRPSAPNSLSTGTKNIEDILSETKAGCQEDDNEGRPLAKSQGSKAMYRKVTFSVERNARIRKKNYEVGGGWAYRIRYLRVNAPVCQKKEGFVILSDSHYVYYIFHSQKCFSLHAAC